MSVVIGDWHCPDTEGEGRGFSVTRVYRYTNCCWFLLKAVKAVTRKSRLSVTVTVILCRAHIRLFLVWRSMFLNSAAGEKRVI
jgi:hypothetical protein